MAVCTDDPVLCRPYSETPSTSRSEASASYTKVTPAMRATIERVEAIAKARKDRGEDVSMAQVALAWTLAKPYISAPIIGTTKLSQMEDMIKGVQLELTADEVKEIDALYEVQKVQGHA